MSLLSDDSPNSGSKNSKKRMRDAVWQNFSEINDGEDIKMKCNECQQVVAKRDHRFDQFMDRDSFLFDPLFFVAAALDPNTAGFLTEKDVNTAIRKIQNLPQVNTSRTTSFALNATLDQLPEEFAPENTNARKQKEIVQASAASRIRETMNRVLSASSPGMNALKYWANMNNTDARPIAVLALEVCLFHQPVLRSNVYFCKLVWQLLDIEIEHHLNC
uniref:Uncharacterized protein n=1 Tax=Ditylenchus dipsaci TaxID=166011 RepID=A0A915CTZ8_9BILA